MRHHDIDPPNSSAAWKVPNVRSLAEKALIELAAQSTPESGVLCPPLIDLFAASLLDPMDRTHCDAVAQMTSVGVTSTDILDLYIPESARRIGDLWVSDQCSFVDVSVAASRLQRLLRTVARDFDARVFLDRPPPRALVIIPEGEQHSIGGALATNQMRRAGVGAEIIHGANPGNLIPRIAHTPYALIGVSVGSERTLEKLNRLIEAVVDAREEPPGILIGGWAIDTLPDAINHLPIAPVGTSVAEGLAYLSKHLKSAADITLKPVI